MFQGLVDLETTGFPVVDLVKTVLRVPVNADALPTYRVYGKDGLVATGTMAFHDTGSITDATNSSPIIITSEGHGLATGDRVTITGVVGNESANDTFVITVSDANTFSLDGSTGGGSYTSGGTWNVTGLYSAVLDVTQANGYAAGETYTLMVFGLVSASNYGEIHTFTVV